jgi:DNA repair protein RadC
MAATKAGTRVGWLSKLFSGANTRSEPFEQAAPVARELSEGGFNLALPASVQSAAHPGWSMPTPPPEPIFATVDPNGHRKRMRARILTHGTSTLAEYEVLEVLLFGAFRFGDTKPTAKSLINRFGSLAGVLAAPQSELMATKGIGPHTVTLLKIVQECALCLTRGQIVEQPVLNNWDRLMDYLTAALAREKIEQFRILFLDPRNRLIADEAQQRGTVNHTPVYPREVVKRALELHATAIILVHNHPSGDPTPSEDDIDMTAEIAIAARVMAITLHDHIIVGNGRWTSFRQEGLLARG